jgi:molybdopterin-dependent oxidoreductase alpha subunit
MQEKKDVKRTDRVSLVPTGLGEIKPNHYLDMAKVVWRNRDQLPFAWRILSRGVCDGCALGTSGLKDYTLEGVHLCMVRLELLRLNTMPALDTGILSDVSTLRSLSAAELRELGRLPYPMLRRRAEAGFTRITWEQALELAGTRVTRCDPRRIAFYLTSRGLTNESYYVAQKVARFLGSNNIDHSSRICHSPSTLALKGTIGVSASTCSYKDWIGSDLLVFFGSNTPNNQPVTTKYIYEARKLGAKVAVINPYREPGLERYWIPSIAESALFGTKLTDEFFQVNIGGDRAFIAGVIKHLIENGWEDAHFVREHTEGFDDLRQALSAMNWEEIESASGSSRDEMQRFARMLAVAKTAVFVWSMGITQHQRGVDNVRAIVDLALARGFVGKPKSGLMPIRGHSGVQGGSETGAVPNQFPGWIAVDDAGAAQMTEAWGFPVPSERGLDAVQMIDAAAAGEIDWFYQSGGNFLETLPEPEYVRRAVENIPVRVHQDIVLSPQMLVDPDEFALLLPAQTRYEQKGGGTETTTERRILFSPEIPGRRIGEARAEWAIPMLIAEHARPDLHEKIHFEDAAEIRREIARVIPAYAGIERFEKTGDQVQWGGERLCETESEGVVIPRFPTSTGRARFSPISFEQESPGHGLRLTTRRGKQFNSMIQRERDPLTGASRDDVLVSEEDAARLGLRNGQQVVVRSATGEMPGRCLISPMRPGNVEVHWPEGNVLIARNNVDAECGIPDYNTTVEILPATHS